MFVEESLSLNTHSTSVQHFYCNNNNNNNSNNNNNNNNNIGIHSSISTEWPLICWNPSYWCIRYRTGLQHRGDSPTLFEKCCGIFKVPCIGLVEVGRLGQWLNIPTQGHRIVQIGDVRPFSLVLMDVECW